ncbi:MAG: bifunctional sugar-1-phosphate nucleotidylyltransferase/acetyltransferase [Desulfurococcaceae archaeon TW002]
MEALLLAAGYGKGLEPLTHTKNKVMIPVINKALLDHHVENLVKAGINRIVVVVSYLRDQVVERARILAEKFSCDVRVVDQGKPLGTGDAVRKGLEEISSDYFLVVYGDIYVGYNDLVKLVKAGKNLVGAYEVSDPRRYGVLIVNEDLVLRDIIEKPEVAYSNLINAGIYLLSSKVRKYLDELQPSPRGEYELTDAIVKLSREESVRVIKLDYWKDLGRPWNLLELNKDLMSSWREPVIKGRVESGVVIKNAVYIDEGAEILSGTYLVGPAYIGRDAVVGPNSYIRPYTVILEEAKIGFSVEVKESIIMSKTHASHLTYLGDSIIGEGCNLGAGTITANLRFDEKSVNYVVKGVKESTNRVKFGAVFGDYVKTGVDVSIMPGMKVGAYSWIYPGAIVTRDVPPCSIYVSEEDIRVLRDECRVDKDLWVG